jgi:hypothetical protein
VVPDLILLRCSGCRDVAAAEQKYRDAIELNPEHPFAWANLVGPVQPIAVLSCLFTDDFVPGECVAGERGGAERDGVPSQGAATDPGGNPPPRISLLICSSPSSSC